jgi:hypothetical protein
VGAAPVLAGEGNGNPDTPFTTNTGTGFSARVNDVAVQSNGKIIVGGGEGSTNTGYIARLNADGTPDTERLVRVMDPSPTR